MVGVPISSDHQAREHLGHIQPDTESVASVLPVFVAAVFQSKESHGASFQFRMLFGRLAIRHLEKNDERRRRYLGGDIFNAQFNPVVGAQERPGRR